MKQKPPLNRRGFTLIELLVVITIIGIMAALIVPSVMKALNTAHLMQAVNNGQELQKAALSASLDASQNGSYSIAWPGDMTKPPTDLVGYANALKAGGFISDFRNLVAEGIPVAGTILTAKNIAFSFGLVNSLSPENVPFLTTKNFNPVGITPRDPTVVQNQAAAAPQDQTAPAATPDSNSTPSAPGTDTLPATTTSLNGASGPVNPAAKPFGSKGFVVVRKAGDASSYQKPSDPFEAQGEPGNFIWGLDPSRANPPVPWVQTPQQ